MTAPPYSPGDPTEAGIFNASNWAEDIALVRNQGLEIDDDMEPDPENVSSVYTPAYYMLFERQIWGWGGIDSRAVVAQNQNYYSFKTFWSPQSLYYLDIFLHCTPLKWLIIVLLPSTSRAVKEAYINLLTLGDLLSYLDSCTLMST